MKFSQLEKLFHNYDDAKYSPSRTGVYFGCDCGCGGDSYTIEKWNREEEDADKAIEKMKEFCLKYNIEWDGV